MIAKQTNNLILISMIFLCIATFNTTLAVTEILVDGTSFDNWTALESEWNYYYPWGQTHNGSAKMYISQLSLSNGELTITAETPDPESTYTYRSGAIHLKETIHISEQWPEWSVYGEFRAPYLTGTWPAFWITHAGSWTHECDILEYKGDRYNWFNTYDGGWETNKVWVADNLEVWHSYELRTSKLNDTDVTTQFYLDGVLQGTHTLSGGMDKSFWLIINLQMEGSSGSPGPTDPTYYYARNVTVTRTEATPPEGPPSAPANLFAVAEDSAVYLKWDPSPEWDTNHYNVYSSTTAGGPYSLVATDVTDIKYLDSSLVNGTTYYYVVTAVDNDLNESLESNEASATPEVYVQKLIAHYAFEGNANDSAGLNDGTTYGSPAYTTGHIGQAIDLDGSDDYITLPPGLPTVKDFTMAAWVNWDGGDIWQRIFDFGNDTYEYMFVSPSSGNSTLRFAITTDSYWSEEILETSQLPSGQWYHVAVTLNGDTGTLYVNSVAEITGTILLDPYDLLPVHNYIGKSQFADPLFDGRIDEFRLYNYALSASEIANLYSSGADTTPPAAPTNLAATAGNSNVSLNWDDNTEGDLASYAVYRSTTSGSGYVSIATGVATSNYMDNSVTNGTTYYYVVTAVDESSNESAYSNEASATPDVGGDTIDVANADIAVSGSVSGTYVDTQASDDIYESITEIESGGRPQNRHTYLEHKWTVNVTGGDTVTFYVQAHHTANTENDDFIFAYSTNDSTYTDMLTVTKTSDDDTYQSYSLPPSLSGTVYIRVLDTDQTSGNRSLDTVYVDHMYILSAGGEPDTTPPAAPTNLSATGGDGSVSLNWDDNTELDLASYTVYRSTTSGSGYSSIASSVSSSHYVDTTVTNGTTYYYVVTAVDASSNESGYSNEASATPAPDTTPPAAPTNLAATAGDGTVSLDWDDNAESDLDSYSVYRSTTSGSGYMSIATGVSSSDYVDNTVTNGTTYYYVVTAVDTSSNESANSNEASATPQAGTEPDMYVNDIAMGYRNAGPNYFGQATVWIKDNTGANVEGATVYGDWSGATIESVSGTTLADGTVLFESSKVRNGGTFSFTVTDVVMTGYVYNPALNVETSDSITAP